MHVGKVTRERGDTLIEVLVAISVLGVVIVGTFSLMNKGLTQMYNSMEKSEVRFLLNSQIEQLTYARDQHQLPSSGSAYDTAAYTVWSGVLGHPTTTVPAVQSCTPSAGTAFWIKSDDVTGTLSYETTISATTADGFPSPGNGIWIQKVNSSLGGSLPSYKDFYVRACWKQTSGSTIQVMSTVVRLND